MAKTVYELATEAMYDQIKKYRTLLLLTDGLRQVTPQSITNPDLKLIFAAGIRESASKSPSELVKDHQRKSAVLFDIEHAVSFGVYIKIREHAEILFNEASQKTNSFSQFKGEVIAENPHLLPVFQQLFSQVSKAQLKKVIGSLSDQQISKPAATRLAEYLQTGKDASKVKISKDTILQRMEPTLEGIVRDLVGRVLLEEIVAAALTDLKVPFLREEEYSGISGVVYDNRADFVIPDEKNPIAFIEVRKSSSRHASLYAKDKMFSAINWKGKHKNLIAAIVVDGEWTQATLQTMSKIFDYVIPIHETEKLAAYLKKATEGDNSIQKWIINFSISEKN